MKNYYLSFFFQAGHVTRHVGNLSHGNRLISFSFGDSAWATRTPEDYTNQTESRWKEVTMSWAVSKWIFYGGGGVTNVLKYMWNAVLYEWQYFLDFEKKKLRYQWLFPFVFATSHINVDWFNTMCLSLSERWSYIR